MITEKQASLVMSKIQGYLIKKLEREHFIFPSLILMDRDHHVRVEDLKGDFQCILEVNYEDPVSEIYVTRITMRNRNEEDDGEILRFIEEVTRKHQAEATGYFAQCLYKPMVRQEYDSLTTTSMNMDPDAIRVLHNCFFIKGGNEKGYLMITPYTLKDSKEVMEFQVTEYAPKVATVFSKGWESPSFTLETRINNPYL